MKSKQLQKGLTQLAEEGATQVFRPLGTSDYILGAVGVLQFDVTAHRLKQEYGADTVYEAVDLTVARWVDCDDPRHLKAFEQENTSFLAIDAEEKLTFIAPSQWRLEHVMEQWPKIEFKKTREYN